MEEDEILAQFKAETSTSANSKIFYAFSSLAVASVPLAIYLTIFSMSFSESFLIFFLVTLASAGALAYGYNNVATAVKSKLSHTRQGSITKAKAKKIKGKIEEQRQKQKEITESEATSLSILYNNLFFLMLVVIFAFYLVRSLPSTLNYIIAVGGSAACVSFLSTVQ
eukprot:TRINITY_DN1176_c0_g1_i1.p1 TRINITY_DN1176_c0_g1~~TRINITY_DN1176_c0_g1_i1.p1  ORF type:complete len:167 (-),score=26.28 TRINITY_DN1176_c0_g1_i1:80-580(-)